MSGQNQGLSDFSTLRIYWKFYMDKEMTLVDEENLDPRKLRKSYFLYFNNTIREVVKNDIPLALSFCSEKIKEKTHFHNI